MRMTLLSFTSSWLCATGVAIVASYLIMTHYQCAERNRIKAAQVATRISRRGTIAEFKPTTRHSSAIKKATKASVVKVKEVKLPTFVTNPIYAPFMNALDGLVAEVADIAKDGEVRFDDGFSLVNTNGTPVLRFPEEYAKVSIGGVAIGDKLNGGFFWAHRKRIDGTDQYMIDEVALSGYRRLEEPEFYCTQVTYSVLPVTRQVDAIRMHGDLSIGRESKAGRVVREIAKWMKEDFGAKDLRADVPEDTLAFKKFRIGKRMYVEVAVNWKSQKADDGTDAYIDISFTASELVEENLAERQELGAAADEARESEYCKTGVNYFTVRPRVKLDDVMRKVVY